jgi:transposase
MFLAYRSERKESKMSKKQDSKNPKSEADVLVRMTKRQARRKFSAEEKIRIVIAGMRGEESVAELCRREGIHQNLYYRWNRDSLFIGWQEAPGW